MDSKEELEVGDRVRDKYRGWIGTIIKVWDGKYYVDYYEGECYNPNRVTVKLDVGDDSIIMARAEHLERI